MRMLFRLATVALLGPVGACQPSGVAPKPAQAAEPTNAERVDEVSGKTQPVPGRKGVIAPVVLHPVEKVFAAAGDRVKKDQVLVKIDDDEPQADLRAKKAALTELQASLARLKAQPREEERNEARAGLESARGNLKHIREQLARLEPAWLRGAVPDQRYHETRAALRRYVAEERAASARLERLLKQPIKLEMAELEAKIAGAKAAMEAAQAELEHYTVTAGINGVVSWLDVHPGTVSRPGTSVWGEILDLSEIDVRCDLTPRQADKVRVGQKAEVLQEGNSTTPWSGRVVSVGIAADPSSGRVPVLVRLPNPDYRLRCYVPVKVRFGP